jgi:hypothetical protein
LLKLRVSFKENATIDNSYRVDFKLTDEHEGHMILLKGPRNQNQATGQWKGQQGLKARYLEKLGDQ